MAGLGAVHGLGESLVRHLRAAYSQARHDEQALPQTSRILPACAFDQLATGQLAGNFTPAGTQVGLLLYRVGFDPHSRAASADRLQPPLTRPLALELHYLLSVWSGAAAEEHAVLGWTMRELHRRPTLDRSMLVPPDVWEPDETVSIVPAELDTEALFRIWDGFTPKFRLSAAYVARVVRLGDDRPGPAARPVVATRYALREMPENV